jgi:hypothetical protein
MRRFSAALLCGAGATAVSPALAAEAHTGRWALNPAACAGFGDTQATAPLIVSDTTLRWLQSCRIGKSYKLGQALYIQARCAGEGASDIPVTLDLRTGDRLRVTWNGGKTAELRRCK